MAFRSLSLVSATGSKKSIAATTRIEPTSPGENTVRPRFIRIKEVPQIRERRISRITALALLGDSGMGTFTDLCAQRLGIRHVFQIRFLLSYKKLVTMFPVHQRLCVSLPGWLAGRSKLCESHLIPYLR